MKQIFIFSAILVLAVSCKKESEFSNEEQVTVSFFANIDNNTTKLTYDKESDVYKGSWTTGDKISLISENNTNAEFTDTTGNQFTGSITPWSGSKDIYAVYPYNSTPYTISSGMLTFDASSQTIAAGSANYANTLLVAKANGSSSSLPGMYFTQAMAIVKIDIKNVPEGVTVTKVAVINQDMYSNQTLVKSASINMADGTIEGTPIYTNNVVGTVTGATAGAETFVNFALLPTTTAAKYSFCVTLSNGKVYKKTLSTAKSFVRNTMYTMEYDLNVVAEEDVLLIVNYEIDGSAIDFSGHQLKLTGSSALYESIKLGYVAMPTQTSFYTAPISSLDFVNGYTVEVYFKPIPSSGKLTDHEHKVIGWTYFSGACVGYSIEATKFYSECEERTKGGFYTWAIQHSDGSTSTFSTYSKEWQSCLGKKIEAVSGDYKWIHEVVTYDATSKTLILYDDKGYVSSFPTNESHHVYNNAEYKGLASVDKVGIGSNQNGGTSPADAYVGPVKIWNRALSVSEVQALYDAEPADLNDDVVRKIGDKSYIIEDLLCESPYNLDVLVCSHRGAWSANDNNGAPLPENSRASLSRAIELNSDLSECDVYITSDGEVVVSHDPNTSRCFNGAYDIPSSTLSTLRTVTMKNGENIPTLEDFLTIIKEQAKDEHLTKLRIEIKDQDATDEALKIVFDAGLEDMCEWISFESAVGPKVKARYDLAGKTTKIGYLGGNMSAFESYKANGFNMIDCNGLSDENAAAALNSGLYLGAWTYNDVDGMKSRMLQQSYSITTNQTTILQTLISDLKASR